MFCFVSNINWNLYLNTDIPKAFLLGLEPVLCLCMWADLSSLSLDAHCIFGFDGCDTKRQRTGMVNYLTSLPCCLFWGVWGRWFFILCLWWCLWCSLQLGSFSRAPRWMGLLLSCCRSTAVSPKKTEFWMLSGFPFQVTFLRCSKENWVFMHGRGEV